ncbi:hypothetical protein [Vibrio sp. M260112]|uniref:hypothetical protein n=1 Tax=Vibrio sp. M260112 TaxID=3020895 RepID=UPI002F42C627
MKQLITKVTSGCDTVLIYNAGFVGDTKAATAYFAGNDGWGITMTMPLCEVTRFVGSTLQVRAFIQFAKSKLGLEE